MRYICIFLLFTSLTPKKKDYAEIDVLLCKIHHKAQNGEVDKDKIKKWLDEQECYF